MADTKLTKLKVIGESDPVILASDQDTRVFHTPKQVRTILPCGTILQHPGKLPSRWHRFWGRLILGIRWEDA